MEALSGDALCSSPRRPRRPPGDGVALRIGERDDGVVEGGVHVHLPNGGRVLRPLAGCAPGSFYSSCHYASLFAYRLLHIASR
mgnify:CR=1 FL=1